METTTRKRPTVPRLSGLPSTRSGALALALVCALAAAGVIIYAVGQYRKSVNASARQTTVLVAGSLIQKWTSGQVIGAQQLVKATPVVAGHLQVGAITDVTQLQGRVALQNILPGQQLNASQFGPTGGYATQLAPDERAISVPIDASHGLAGVLQAGDHVDMYAGDQGSASGTVSSPSSANGASATVTATASAGLRLLLTNVYVMAINLNSSGGGVGGSAGSVTSSADVLLKVKAADAGAVAYASDTQKIWLVLRGANAITPKTQNGVPFTFSMLIT